MGACSSGFGIHFIAFRIPDAPSHQFRSLYLLSKQALGAWMALQMWAFASRFQSPSRCRELGKGPWFHLAFSGESLKALGLQSERRHGIDCGSLMFSLYLHWLLYICLYRPSGGQSFRLAASICQVHDGSWPLASDRRWEVTLQLSVRA